MKSKLRVRDFITSAAFSFGYWLAIRRIDDAAKRDAGYARGRLAAAIQLLRRSLPYCGRPYKRIVADRIRSGMEAAR